ncbi:phage tail tape measure protein [Streptomyces racemochromogenes]|uniref:phage tail tape measure protein n=1 Tax=Streptomyces racemochromogenes TaxID=67353 RepID=UPI0031ECD0D4
MPNVGYATIQIIPSVRGISDELRRQLGGPAADAGDQAGRESGGRFAERFKAALAVGGAAAGAVLAAATISAIEKEKLSDRLSAQLGLSGKGAEKAGKLAGTLYSKAVVDSFEDGAAAVRAVMGSGLIPEKATSAAIESITTKVADLASTFDQDLGGAANAAAQMIRTGLAKDAPQALDLLTKGLQSGADKAGDFLDTINEYGTQFRKAGLDGASAIGLLNQAIAAGARDGDLAADAIKEFTIRALDGSKSTTAGFELLGLSADDMAKKFAAGGSSATGVLELTLDRLRAVKDPVDQSAAAVSLFGTQAEDLGAALLAMDPSTAAAGLGKVDGAAKAVGDTIRDNTATQLATLSRELMSGVGVAVDTFILPALLGLVSALRNVDDVVGPVIAWFREWGAWLLPVIVLVGGLTLALNAQAIATGAITLVFSAYRAAILIGTAVTTGFAGAQALLNAVMALNPITLIVIALLALGAALVVAYNKSETFRAVVQAAWEGIKTVALWVWENVLKPAFNGFMVGLRAIADAAIWLWGVLQPVFSFIGAAGRILATIILTVLITPIVLAVKLLGAIFGWLWNTVLKPIWDLMAAGAIWLWNNGIKPAFDLIMAQVRNLAAIFGWLWNNIVKPIWNYIAGLIAEKWQQIKFIFDVLVAYVKLVLIPMFMRFWNETIKPAWEGIKSIIANAWNTGIKPIFDLLSKGVDRVKESFHAGITGIGLIWDKLREITRKPVQFVIDTVYNNGIRKVWNTIAEFTGVGKLGVVTFATGGAVFGAGTATSDSIPALLSNGEHVWTAREVQGAGGHAAVEALRARAASSGSAFAKGGAVGGIPRYAEGGIVDWLSGTAKKIGGAIMTGIDFLSSPGKAWDTATKFLRDQVSSGLSGSQWAQALSQFPIKMLQGLKNKVIAAAESLTGGSASGNVAAAMGFARSQAGKPYQWGGAGNPSWDCSGFMSGIQKVIEGRSPLGRLWSTFSFQGNTAPAGWHRNLRSPFMIGITNDGVGHTAGTLGGMNVESRGGDGVVVGSRARGYNSALFHDRYGFAPALKTFDSGGWLQPGLTLARNDTGKPEPILTSSQWDAIGRSPAGGADQRSYHITLQGSQMTSAEQAADLVRRLQFTT